MNFLKFVKDSALIFSLFLFLFVLCLGSAFAQSQAKKLIFPDEIETFEFSLTFPLDFPSQRVLSNVSRIVIDRALDLIGVKTERNINPDEFIQRVSIKRREPKPEGVQYTFVSSINIRKLLFFVATGEKTYSVNLSNCSFIAPIITRALIEYAVQADITCYITYIEEKSGISTLKIDISGSVGKLKTPLRFRKEYYFFSIFPYDVIYNDILIAVDNLVKRKIFKIIEYSFETKSSDKVLQLINALSGKAYFYSVIPFEISKKGELYKIKLYLLCFDIIPDNLIQELIVTESQKIGVSLIQEQSSLIQQQIF
ncbi:MAG: hypothetical protein NZ927_00820 [Candidatus Calescibacterium sp.]|nr:hypothetical protein [Candidatus Calescibacterium sp.]MDW8086691.1 hypothetical protein [Candidatus Calescibacterium sp.]